MPRRSTGWEDRDDAQDHQRLRRILHAGGRSGRRAIRAGDLAGHGAGDALGRATRSRRCSADRLATARGRAGARSPHEPHRARAGVRQPAASPSRPPHVRVRDRGHLRVRDRPPRAAPSQGRRHVLRAPDCRSFDLAQPEHGPAPEASRVHGRGPEESQHRPRIEERPMAIIDSQVHVYEANTPKRPWHSVPNWPDHVTGDEMVAAMDRVGVDGAIFISAFSMYRYDASYAVEVQQAHPGRFALVKPVDPDDPAVADVIADWKKTPGAVGIRIMLTKEANRAPDDPGLERILRAAVRRDFPVNMLCWGNVDAGAALIDRHPDTRFIIDHLAIMQPRTPPAPPQPWADLPKVLDLAKRRNAVIKVSGACTLSREPYPFPDIWDPLARVFDAWGFERCLWGTDWTRAFAVVNYEQVVEPFRQTDRLSDSERAMLMGGACAKAYGWSPKKG